MNPFQYKDNTIATVQLYTTYTWGNSTEEAEITVNIEQDRSWIYSSADGDHFQSDLAEARIWYVKLCKRFGKKPMVKDEYH